jgi:hypothetical protein
MELGLGEVAVLDPTRLLPVVQVLAKSELVTREAALEPRPDSRSDVVDCGREAARE